MNNVRRLSLTLIGLFLLTGLTMQAQQKRELDSLLALVKTLPDDTIKAYTYSRIARWGFVNRDIGLATQYADSMAWLSERLRYEKGVIDAQYRKSEVESFEGRYSDAIVHLTNYLEFYKKRNDAYRTVNALFGLGKAYKRLGDFDKSLSFFYEAIKICEQTNDLDGAAMAWNSTSSIYRQMGLYKEAIQHYKLANKTYLARGKIKDYAMGLQNMGIVYVEMGDYDSALLLYDQALDSVKKLNTRYEEAIILGNIGDLYYSMENYHEALAYQLQSLTIRKELPNKRSLAHGLLSTGRTYFELNSYTTADKHLKEAAQLAHEIQAKDLLRMAYGLLGDNAVAKGDFKNAYQYSQVANQWNDSLFNERSEEQMQELKMKYETEKKDQQITMLAKEKELQEKEAERQSTITKASMTGLGLVVLLAVLIVYITRQKLKNQKLIATKDTEIKEAHFKQQMSELEMKALRAQINPHFLFNCLNSINRMILEGESDNASLYLAKFSKLIRSILENSETSRVSLNNELTLLESYIELEGLRFKGRINYKIEIDKAIDPNMISMPCMILQPFVENAIWHGLMHMNEGDKGVVEITIKEKDGTLYCIIEDNGVGRERARQLANKSVLKSKSMGMKITEERLRLLTHEQANNLIHIVDLKDPLNQALGTRVEISVPGPLN